MVNNQFQVTNQSPNLQVKETDISDSPNPVAEELESSEEASKPKEKKVSPSSKPPQKECPVVTDTGPLYNIDPLKYSPTDYHKEEDEVFECECDHWRQSLCTVKGDVRIDASRNVVVLYAKKKGTRRGIQVIKPYPRKWEVDMMQGVHDVIIKSTDPPEDLVPWKPTPPENDGLSPRNGHRGIDPLKAKDNWDQPIKLGENKSWNEHKWLEKRAKRLWRDENPLSEYEIEREEFGKVLLGRKGAKLDKEGPHGWVIFNDTKFATKEDLAHFTPNLKCDVNHSVPGIIFANSGWTGNIYHEFNDGICTFSSFNGFLLLKFKTFPNFKK